MSDTSLKLDTEFRKRMLKKTSEERLKMGCSMYDMAKAIVISSIKAKVGTSTSSLRVQILTRFYSDIISAKEMPKIVKHFRNL